MFIIAYIPVLTNMEGPAYLVCPEVVGNFKESCHLKHISIKLLSRTVEAEHTTPSIVGNSLFQTENHHSTARYSVPNGHLLFYQSSQNKSTCTRNLPPLSLALRTRCVMLLEGTTQQ